MKRTLLLFLMILLLVFPVSIALASDIRPVTYTEFDNLIQRSKGSATFICLYDTTCPTCCKHMPTVNYLCEKYGKKGLRMLILSLDESPEQLAYGWNNQQIFFEPIWLSEKMEGGLASIMTKYGGNYRNAVPYTAILNKSGKVVKDWTSIADYSSMKYWIEKSLGIK